MRVLSLAIDLAMMILLVSQFHMNETLAKIADNVIIVVVNYAVASGLSSEKRKKRACHNGFPRPGESVMVEGDAYEAQNKESVC